MSNSDIGLQGHWNTRKLDYKDVGLQGNETRNYRQTSNTAFQLHNLINDEVVLTIACDENEKSDSPPYSLVCSTRHRVVMSGSG